MKAKPQTAATLAASALANANITLATTHVSGVSDNANALQNIQDTANGAQASRSQYGNAPGGVVSIDENTLQGLLDLAATYSFRVSEVAGGSHSSGSAHYYGLAFDIDQINGAAVNSGNPDYQALMTLAKSKGAIVVLGPGDPHHDTHVHAAYAAGFMKATDPAADRCEASITLPSFTDSASRLDQSTQPVLSFVLIPAGSSRSVPNKLDIVQDADGYSLYGDGMKMRVPGDGGSPDVPVVCDLGMRACSASSRGESDTSFEWGTDDTSKEVTGTLTVEVATVIFKGKYREV